MSWHNTIFDCKFKTIEAENREKVKNRQHQLRIFWFL